MLMLPAMIVAVWVFFLIVAWICAPVLRDSWRVQTDAIAGFFLALLAALGFGYLAFTSEQHSQLFVNLAAACLPVGMVLGAVLGKLMDVYRAWRRRQRQEKREEQEKRKKKREGNLEVREDELG